jgi:serine protease Do
MPAHAEESLALREEAAFKAAVEGVAPAVVRIETIGGLERVGKVLFGTGPTTGLVASPDGYIVASAFNFAQKPASILVTLADGTRLPARLVSTDHSRMLVLLKVDPAQPLPVAEAAPEEEIRIGQWSIAVGRAFEGPQPNVSIGIVSAVRRVWGKAIQTDAKISPNNYGGPLVDLRGRVLGVLVPLSPQGATILAGVEWYDSGIGFAVPWEHILQVLPRWKEGDLHPGVMGVSFKAGNQFADPAVISACRVNSPAYKAGLEAGDKIVELEGHRIVRQSQVKEVVTPRYAGDTIKLAVLRGEERLERELTLVETLEPYAHPFLGFLPMRDADRPLSVRYIYPNSPAEKAGLQPGDVIRSLNGDDVASRADVVEKLVTIEPGDEVVLSIERQGAAQQFMLKTGSLPEAVPPTLPPARQSRPAAAERPAVGRFEQEVPEYDNKAVVYVPEAYDPAVGHGLVIHLSGDGSYEADDLLALYKPHCDAHDLLLLAPQTVAPADAKARRRWDPIKDVAYIGKLLLQLGETYKLDRTRVVVHGYQGGGALSFLLAARHRDWIRAVAAIEALPARSPPENEPAHRLAFYLGLSRQGTTAATRETAVEKIRAMKYPVTLKDLGDQSRALNAEELSELIRWIDTLDRL